MEEDGIPVEGKQGIEEVTEGKPDLAKDRADCLAKNTQQNVFRYIYLVGKDCYNKTMEVVECGSCYRTTVDSTSASSPAFLEGVTEDYDWASGLYPTWTESIWKVINARVLIIFCEPSVICEFKSCICDCANELNSGSLS